MSSGICYSAAVLCNPYLAIIPIVGIISFLLPKHFVDKKALLFFYSGIFTAFIAFLFYYLQAVSIKEIVDLMPNLLPALQRDNYSVDSMSYVLVVNRIIGHLSYEIGEILIYYTIFIIFVVAMRVLNFKLCSNMSYKKHVVYVLVFFYVIMFVRCGFCGNIIGMHFIPCIAVAVGVFFLLEYNVSRDTYLFGIVGIIVAVAGFLASNTGSIALGNGLLFVVIAACRILEQFWQEQSKENQKAIGILFGGIIISVILITGYLRITYIYRDNVDGETTMIAEGPAKGIVTGVENNEQYTQIYHEILEHVTEEDTLLISKLLPWDIYVWMQSAYHIPHGALMWETLYKKVIMH